MSTDTLQRTFAVGHIRRGPYYRVRQAQCVHCNLVLHAPQCHGKQLSTQSLMRVKALVLPLP